MSVDKDTVRRIAKLARLAIDENRSESMVAELNAILDWVARLEEVDVTGVAPLTSVVEQKLKMRADVVSEGDNAEALMTNAPLGEDHFFVVPKVVD